MKLKHLAGTCAMALCAIAQAQTTTSGFYGRANLSIENQTVGKKTTQVMVDNSSRLGFKADRTLPGQLKAGVVLEAGTNLTTGSTASNFFAREANTWLAGEFGEVRLGRMAANTAYFATADYISNHNHDTGTSSDALYDFLASMKNAVSYTAPKIGPLSLQAQVGLKNGSGVGTNETGLQVNPVALSGTYDMGALNLGLGYERAGNAEGKAISATAVRAAYTVGPFNYGVYVQTSSGPSNGRTSWRLSGMYTLGQNEFHINFGAAGKRNNETNTAASQVSLAYNYNLDKATKLYALITNVKNDSAAKYTVSTDGHDLRSIGAGFRYNF